MQQVEYIKPREKIMIKIFIFFFYNLLSVFTCNKNIEHKTTTYLRGEIFSRVFDAFWKHKFYVLVLHAHLLAKNSYNKIQIFLIFLRSLLNVYCYTGKHIFKCALWISSQSAGKFLRAKAASKYLRMQECKRKHFPILHRLQKMAWDCLGVTS